MSTAQIIDAYASFMGLLWSSRGRQGIVAPFGWWRDDGHPDGGYMLL